MLVHECHVLLNMADTVVGYVMIIFSSLKKIKNVVQGETVSYIHSESTLFSACIHARVISKLRYIKKVQYLLLLCRVDLAYPLNLINFQPVEEGY